MLILYLLGWMVLGYISVFVALMIHLLRAINNGYDPVDFWNNYIADFKGNTKFKAIKLIFGLIIWPVRLIQFLTWIPELYEMYD